LAIAKEVKVRQDRPKSQLLVPQNEPLRIKRKGGKTIKMLEELLMQKRAKAIIDLAQIGKGDKVLILCDYHTASVGKQIAAQAYQVAAVPT